MPNIFLFGLILLSISCISDCWADVIRIKNAGRIEGIIEKETNDKIVVRIKFGTVILERENIESIETADKEENDALLDKWNSEKEEKRLSKPKEKEKTSAQEKASPGEPKGTTGEIEVIKCMDNIHSYAVCLPPTYGQAEKHPVLFCFDPGGNGTEAVRRFTFAAEKYGWIVVGSLDARNGPWEPIQEAQKSMLLDVKKRYNINQHRFYAAGFSGGARMSYTIAYANPSNFKGVIACGAGFGKGTISGRVAVYHCIGEQDSNLNEVKKAHEKLRRIGADSKLHIFSGGHSYPPDDVLKKAADWIVRH